MPLLAHFTTAEGTAWVLTSIVVPADEKEWLQETAVSDHRQLESERESGLVFILSTNVKHTLSHDCWSFRLGSRYWDFYPRQILSIQTSVFSRALDFIMSAGLYRRFVHLKITAKPLRHGHKQQDSAMESSSLLTSFKQCKIDSRNRSFFPIPSKIYITISIQVNPTLSTFSFWPDSFW